MRKFALIFLTLAWSLSLAEPTDYETTIEVSTDSVGSLLEKVEERLEMNLRSEEIASRARSLGPGSVYQREFDISHGGMTFTAIYQVARLEEGLVSISFTAYQRHAIEAICREFANASAEDKEDESSTLCDFRQPETFRA